MALYTFVHVSARVELLSR